MKTVLETLQSGAGYFEKHGVESPRLEMEHLLAHVLGCERLQLYLDFDRPLGESELEPLRVLVKRRVGGEPLQHLLGVVEFHGRDFLCDGRALIPRPETEQLVELVLRKGPAADARVLDMGTGSGVIGLTLAAEMEGVRVTLADISPQALALAGENAARLELAGERLRFVESNLFSGLDGEFDVIVANLPYLSGEDMMEISEEVSRDPVTALSGGESGVEIMERFIGETVARLSDGGWVAMEIGAGQAPDLSAALGRAGLEEVEMAKDYAGIDRFLIAAKAEVK